jgi:hypothetical protein
MYDDNRISKIFFPNLAGSMKNWNNSHFEFQEQRNMLTQFHSKIHAASKQFTEQKDRIHNRNDAFILGDTDIHHTIF